MVAKKQDQAEVRRLELRRLLATRDDIDATNLSKQIGKGKDFFRDFLAGRKRDVSSEAWEAAMAVLHAPSRLSQEEINAQFDAKDVHLLSLALKELTGSEVAARDLLPTVLGQIYKHLPDRADRLPRNQPRPPRSREDE